MAQITSIVSEALQAKVRALLPSQSGFTEDLQAQNVIVPIVDLTETASGSSLRADLQTAYAFGSNSEFQILNGTTDIANVGGFYRVAGVSNVTIGANSDRNCNISITDGASTVILWKDRIDTGTGAEFNTNVSFDFVVFVNSGETLQAISSAVDCVIAGSVRQIADLTGNLVNPSGFTIE
tara:strand:- start:166 stop:705 length:540 start_codon:yes stop_codon:yes gene_type:complete